MTVPKDYYFVSSRSFRTVEIYIFPFPNLLGILYGRWKFIFSSSSFWRLLWPVKILYFRFVRLPFSYLHYSILLVENQNALDMFNDAFLGFLLIFLWCWISVPSMFFFLRFPGLFYFQLNRKRIAKQIVRGLGCSLVVTFSRCKMYIIALPSRKNTVQSKVPELERYLSWNGRSHGESEGANVFLRVFFLCVFCAIRLASVSTQVPCTLLCTYLHLSLRWLPCWF